LLNKETLSESEVTEKSLILKKWKYENW
jgi:hypothetical protein